ncbi:hypothetical protein SCOCK_210098 [Actinacidiphila cocklensis]|uniref:Uncharacterized protein n=1 Tax=Actinacidiphila cocklensis TaxID=887465 RepID=A0A9W4DP02_9ACTN|nr:hypothetical protein SCOCK_210098 [Actinacidiphila cocklensis]
MVIEMVPAVHCPRSRAPAVGLYLGDDCTASAHRHAERVSFWLYGMRTGRRARSIRLIPGR